jgi:hypothetical protein
MILEELLLRDALLGQFGQSVDRHPSAADDWLAATNIRVGDDVLRGGSQVMHTLDNLAKRLVKIHNHHANLHRRGAHDGCPA